MSDGKLQSLVQTPHKSRGASPPGLAPVSNSKLGSFASTAIQTLSMSSSHQTTRIRFSEKKMCELVEEHYLLPEYGPVRIVDLSEAYDQPSRPVSPGLGDFRVRAEGARLMKAHFVQERSEQRFFAPSSSLISSYKSVEKPCPPKMDITISPVPTITSPFKNLESEESWGQQSQLETPSFTANFDVVSRESNQMKSEEFTFGKRSCTEEQRKYYPAESGLNSSVHPLEKGQSEEPSFYNHEEKGRVMSQRERHVDSMIEMRTSEEKEDGKLTERGSRGKQGRGSFEGFGERRRLERRWEGYGEEVSADSDALEVKKMTRVAMEDSEGNEEADRFNLYRYLTVSDSEELAEENGRSETYTVPRDLPEHKIYAWGFEEKSDSFEMDGSQLFADEELRSKYQSLLQHN